MESGDVFVAWQIILGNSADRSPYIKEHFLSTEEEAKVNTFYKIIKNAIDSHKSVVIGFDKEVHTRKSKNLNENQKGNCGE